jgi:hypothetical protein
VPWKVHVFQACEICGLGLKLWSGSESPRILNLEEAGTLILLEKTAYPYAVFSDFKTIVLIDDWFLFHWFFKLILPGSSTRNSHQQSI